MPQNIVVTSGNFSSFHSDKVSHKQLFWQYVLLSIVNRGRYNSCALLPCLVGILTGDASCSQYAFYRQIALIVSQCIVACTSFISSTLLASSSRLHFRFTLLVNQFLRTYALYERSRRIGALIIGVTLVLGAASIVRSLLSLHDASCVQWFTSSHRRLFLIKSPR